MMKYFLAFIAGLTQAYLLPAVSTAVIPNLVLILVAQAALSFNLKSSLGIAIWSGFWLEIAVNRGFGYRLLWLVGLVFGVKWLYKTGVSMTRFSFAWLVVGGFSLLYNLGLWLWLGVGDGQFIALWHYLPRWLAEAGISGALAYVSFRWLKDRFNNLGRSL